MIVTTAQLYQVAYKKFAVGAYNINNLEQTMGLFRGNMQSKAPFIIQLSKGARRGVARPHIPLSMRLDTVIVDLEAARRNGPSTSSLGDASDRSWPVGQREPCDRRCSGSPISQVLVSEPEHRRVKRPTRIEPRDIQAAA